MDTMDKCWQDYREIIEKNPLLSKKEELKLSGIIRKYRSGKFCQKAREKMFNSNLRLVLKEAHAHDFKKVDFLDLVCAGSEGLSIAIDRFNPRKYHTRFTTYALPWIRLRITEFLNENSRVVYIPSHLIHKSHEYKKMLRLTGNEDKNLTNEELMKRLKLSERGLRNLRLSQIPTVSLDASWDDNGEKQNPTTLKDVLTEPSYGPDKTLLVKERKYDILSILKELKPIEQDILSSRYLNDDRSNLSTIGEKYCLTGERVRQIEFIALRKLRRKLKNKFNFRI